MNKSITPDKSNIIHRQMKKSDKRNEEKENHDKMKEMKTPTNNAKRKMIKKKRTTNRTGRVCLSD